MLETYNTPLECVGMVKIILHKGEYDSEEMEVIKEENYKNLIVSNASVLLANLANPNNTVLQGIQYLAVGTGYGTGTATSPQPEASSQTALRTELARKHITSTSISNNVLTLTTTFNETEAVGALCEMGLFGGNATTTSGSGYMFNYKVFSSWSKPNGFKFTVIWTLTF